MRKVDDVDQAKNNGQTHAEQRIETTIDQTDQELGQKGL
jgi:hypothetical protein